MKAINGVIRKERSRNFISDEILKNTKSKSLKRLKYPNRRFKVAKGDQSGAEKKEVVNRL